MRSRMLTSTTRLARSVTTGVAVWANVGTASVSASKPSSNPEARFVVGFPFVRSMSTLPDEPCIHTEGRASAKRQSSENKTVVVYIEGRFSVRATTLCPPQTQVASYVARNVPTKSFEESSCTRGVGYPEVSKPSARPPPPGETASEFVGGAGRLLKLEGRSRASIETLLPVQFCDGRHSCA